MDYSLTTRLDSTGMEWEVVFFNLGHYRIRSILLDVFIYLHLYGISLEEFERIIPVVIFYNMVSFHFVLFRVDMFRFRWDGQVVKNIMIIGCWMI